MAAYCTPAGTALSFRAQGISIDTKEHPAYLLLSHLDKLHAQCSGQGDTACVDAYDETIFPLHFECLT